MAEKKHIDTSREADITVVCGSSGSGKSAYVKQKTASAERVIVWDPDDEYHGPGVVRVSAITQLVDIMVKHPDSPLRVRLVSSGQAAFDLWARAAFAWGDCVAIAEETADVTSPGKAPEGWGTLVRRGRKRGISIYGVTQRPSESDKTIIGNASTIHVGRLTRSQDRDYLSRELDCDKAKIDALQNLEYLQKCAKTGEISAGKLTF